MRWIAKVMFFAGCMGVLTGCTQQCFIHECDKEHYLRMIPAHMDRDPNAGHPPDLSPLDKRPPSTVDNPEREPWHLTLQEAIAISLEQGTTGIQSLRVLGQIADDLLAPTQLRQLEFASDSIRVLSINPAIAGLGPEAAIGSRYDVHSVTQMLWAHTDEQISTPGLLNQNGDRASFESGFYKNLPTGGVGGITFSTVYQNLNQVPANITVINPSYQARADLVFEQPLLQNFGVDINQLLNRAPGVSPGSSLSNAAQTAISQGSAYSAQGYSAGLGAEGILISRLRFDQSRCDFERALNYRVLNVEVAYWNLYNAYVNLYAADQGLRQAHRAWEKLKVKGEVGGVKTSEIDRFSGQYHLFAGDRVQALGQVLEAERVLRVLLGLKADDGKQLIPIDSPSVAPYLPDYGSALEETFNLRPELIATRQELKLRQLDLELQKNFLKPDLRFVSRYGLNGLGTRLDGDGSLNDTTTGQIRSNNALRNLSGAEFSDWNLGVTLNVPLGYRFEHASVRRARLSLAQAYWALRNEENKAESFLTKAYRDITDNYEQIKERRAQREDFGRVLESLLKTELAGANVEVEPLIQAQRDYVNALRQEAQSIAAYNSSLAVFQFAKGTLLQHNSIMISEAGLPECAKVRAVEHERDRSIGLLLRERSLPVPHNAGDPFHANGGLPELSGFSAPSVPALMEGAGFGPAGTGKVETPLPNAKALIPPTGYAPLMKSQPAANPNVEPGAASNPYPSTIPGLVPNFGLTPAPVSSETQGNASANQMWLVAPGATTTPQLPSASMALPQ
jgi:outer membrane protein TolC